MLQEIRVERSNRLVEIRGRQTVRAVVHAVGNQTRNPVADDDAVRGNLARGTRTVREGRDRGEIDGKKKDVETADVSNGVRPSFGDGGGSGWWGFDVDVEKK